MFSAILSFLGGSAFRMLWGEISAHITARREHNFEIERMRLQADLEDRQHERNMKALTVQAELKVQVVRVQGEMDIAKLEAEAFRESVKEGMKPTGIWLIDAWNASIRPAAATLCLWLWLRQLYVAQWAMQGRDWDMVCAILGWFFADRSMGKRGR